MFHNFLSVNNGVLFLLAWYSLITTIFQAVRSEVFLSDSGIFFRTLAGFTRTATEWIIHVGKNVAQVSSEIADPVISKIVYWLILILIVVGFIAGIGALAFFTGIKIAELYKENCLDILTVMVTLVSMAAMIYFGKWIKTILAVNLLLLLLLVQAMYVGIRWYVRGWREARGYY